ncbi:MAG: response regulator [Rhizobiales bacterium]|nr:response regulator [Hyphomicrobiales bacterium]MBO6699714.1 response regulator [Hyphomicrobiales bacterium]MBO6737252.1 response regulator [Hyphomicrobiales bacterium]MBO6911674.1 response regulator [Hyphomicrobiales bacterium]MBO6954904.1 response regulator [Hyphomicrobiales bacterium]
MARLLVAEDDEAVRAFLEKAFELDGHEVSTAEDGAMALEVLAAEEGAFDLLLTDIQMPVMDGIALALSTVRDYPGVPILLMTGYANQRERAHGLESLVEDVIMKPFSLADIRDAVGGVLDKRAA